MLSRKSYREVVKGLEHYRKQHEEDRREHPDAIPIDWKSSLLRMIESIVRNNHERWHKDLGELTLNYLVNQKLLVPYSGGYTFPGEVLLSKEEIVARAKEDYKKIFGEDK